MAYKPFDIELRPETGQVVSRLENRFVDRTGSTSRAPVGDLPALEAGIIRAFDIGVASLAILLLAPLMLIIAAAIRISSGGPVLYRQRRLGLHGETFTCFKFRTMHQNADLLLAQLLAECAQSRAEWKRDQKLRRDPRIIKLGRFLRRASLDELPQLFNVLRGDMSIVGPRPIVPTEAHKYGRYIKSYCKVRPGITGLWQVSGRNNTSYRRRVACDVVYSRRQSAATNLSIIVRTVPVVIGAEGAF